MTDRLHPDDVASISQQVAEQMVERKRAYWIDPETHARDHALITRIRAEREEGRQFRQKIIQSATIWAVILLIGWLGVVIWQAFGDAVRSGGGP